LRHTTTCRVITLAGLDNDIGLQGDDMPCQSSPSRSN